MEKHQDLKGPFRQAAVFSKNVWLQSMIVVYAVFWIFMAISPSDRSDWVLENLLIWLTLLVLVFTYRWFTFSPLSYLLIAIFLSLHTLGAHFSYRIVPFENVVNAVFDVQRDNYDRIVHFSFGLLLAYPIRELTIRVMKIKGGWTYFHSAVIVLACGAYYELIEMWVAKIVAPDIGILFLGTQGDPWDTQHDMELALYGAVITMLFTYLLNRLANKSTS